MKALGLMLVAACASCESPQLTFDRVEIPPRRHVNTESPAERLGAQPGAIDEDATREFLEEQIERREAEGPITEPPPPETVYVEVPRHYDHYRYRYPGSYYGYGYGYPNTYYRRHRGREFSLGNTLFGAGLGAIIGHQSGHRDRGAAIGAGFGLLMDLADR